MDEETTQMLKEILLDKFSISLSLGEVGRIWKYPLLLCHIIKGDIIEFEFKFRDIQVQHGSNLVDATNKFTSIDEEIIPEFTGKWKIKIEVK